MTQKSESVREAEQRDPSTKFHAVLLAEVAEREAEAHYNIAPPHRYHADLDQCKFKRAVAAWLREKAR